MDEQRALLDQLMGVNRNEDRKHEVITDFRDERVCKFYLRGICPYDMFLNTKIIGGVCNKTHSLLLKQEFEKHCKLNHEDIYMFDHQIEKDFINRNMDVERVIKKQWAKVEEEKLNELYIPEMCPEILKISAEIQFISDEIDLCLKDNDADKCLALILRYDTLIIEKELATNEKIKQMKLSVPKIDEMNKKCVCDVCGSFLSTLDSDKRLADHFVGKQHIGYQTIKDFLQECKPRKEFDNRKRDRSNSRGRGGRRRSNSRDRNRRRSRSRDRYNNRGDSRERGRNYRR
jgi:RNA-binding protein Luc7-like 2